MIIDVNAILLVEKNNNNNKSTVTTSKEIIEESPAQEGNLGEVAKTSSILSEIGGKGVKRFGDKIVEPIIPIMEEVGT